MRAFVVEDDAEFRELVRDELERAGWTVDLAEDGIAALSRIRHVVPDLIVLDLLMPNLDGTEVLKLLRSTEVGKRIAVVVTTGAVVDHEVRELATRVLQKPFEVHELMDAVGAVTAPACRSA